MTTDQDSKPRNPDELARELQAWAMDQLAAAVAAGESLDSAIGRMQRAGFELAKLSYRNATELVRALGAVRAIEGVQAALASAGASPATIEESVNLLHAVVAGMKLTEYVDAESATAWLKRCAPGACAKE